MLEVNCLAYIHDNRFLEWFKNLFRKDKIVSFDSKKFKIVFHPNVKLSQVIRVVKSVKKETAIEVLIENVKQSIPVLYWENGYCFIAKYNNIPLDVIIYNFIYIPSGSLRSINTVKELYGSGNLVWLNKAATEAINA